MEDSEGRGVEGPSPRPVSAGNRRTLMGPDSESERLLDSDRSLVESPSSWWRMDNLDSTGPSKVGLSVWEA